MALAISPPLIESGAISRLLMEKSEEIMRRWELSVRQVVPSVSTEPRLKLRNHLPQFIFEMSKSIASGKLEIATRSSEVHGKQRAGLTGYKPWELVSEYGRLRHCIVEVILESTKISPESISQIEDTIDRATSQAIKSYHLALRDEAIQMREEFVSIASHELRTPITSLLLNFQYLIKNVEQMPETTDGRDDVRARLKSCVDQIRRLNHLIHEIIDVSKLRIEEIPMDQTRVEIEPLIRAALHELTATIRSAGSVIQAELQPGLAVMGDPARLQQVFYNLISNALRFGQSRPILIRTGNYERTQAQILVKDKGVGIEDGLKRRVFERFSSFEKLPHQVQSGLGLGLYVARRIIEAHQGTIDVESDPGKGASFFVRLPAAESAK